MLPRLSLLGALVACSSSPKGTEIAMSFARTGGLYDAPFPSDDLRTADGHIDLSLIPDPDQPILMEQARTLLGDADGFAETGAIYFHATAPLDPATLPDLAGSIGDSASVYLVSLDATRADYLQRRPVDVAYLPNGGPYGALDLLAVLPLQGAPLGAGETYVAVVTTDVRDASGGQLSRSDAMSDLVAGRAPASLTGDALASYRTAITLLDKSKLAAIAVFTTGHPTAALDVVRTAILTPPLPALAAPAIGDTFTDYCVFDSMIEMPVYQAGAPPYTNDGGAWAFDGNGAPIVDHTEAARVVFTIPRAPTPAGGWPLVMFVRTGGGGDRPLVDRGVCATPDFTTPIVPGSGPARDLARIGFAGVQVDGPLGGIRNPNGSDEEFLIFNVQNAAALRDNIRQSAVELALFARVVTSETFDASSCTGASTVTFDATHLALMGHSMGAWIAPLALETEPAFGAAVLSGAGGSYIANVMDKQKPIAVATIVSSLLDLPRHGDTIERHDPGLTLLQWAAEPSDPQVYAPAVVHPARSVLMLQGIVDHYILPSIANSTSLALGLDEAGPTYDAANAELAGLGQTPLEAVLPLVGRGPVALPVTANIDPQTTAVVVQHPGDAIEDGHESMFQTEPPKHQYRCFLASWLHGVPSVPPDGAEEDPCP